MSSPLLCLGSAQFGLNYGITNQSGKVNEEEVKKIMHLAKEFPINFIDTAQAYGSSEKCLGKFISDKNSFKFISKLKPQINKIWKAEDILKCELEFKNTLDNLKISELDSFLIHSPNEFLKEDNHLFLKWLSSLKGRGLVKRIGVSIYPDSCLDDLPLRFLEIAQIPLSIYDQRILDNKILKFLIAEFGISIHVRSIFLQGLILQKSQMWPKRFSKKFLCHHKELEKFAETKKSNLLEIALSFVNSFSELEAVVFGVTSYMELKNILSLWNSSLKSKIWDLEDRRIWSWQDKRDIDPRFW